MDAKQLALLEKSLRRLLSNACGPGDSVLIFPVPESLAERIVSIGPNTALTEALAQQLRVII